MRIKPICITLAIAIIQTAFVSINTSLAAGCTVSACIGEEPVIPSGINCATSAKRCYGGAAVVSCLTCPSNHIKTSKTTSTRSCPSISYDTCLISGSRPRDCDGTCTNCSSTNWVSNGIGAQKKTTARCNTATCMCRKSVSYRCSSGYYGSGKTVSGASSPDCTACPNSGKSVAGDNSDITKCYATGGSDASGTFSYTQNCYYTE